MLYYQTIVSTHGRKQKYAYRKNKFKTSGTIYVKTIQNRVTLRFTSGYYLELLTCEIMKLVGKTKKQRTRIVTMYRHEKLRRWY